MPLKNGMGPGQFLNEKKRASKQRATALRNANKILRNNESTKHFDQSIFPDLSYVVNFNV